MMKRWYVKIHCFRARILDLPLLELFKCLSFHAIFVLNPLLALRFPSLLFLIPQGLEASIRVGN